MKLPLFISGRYLFAKKSHNVINIISGISAAGMAIGTAALIIILSVYNGFDKLVEGMMGTVEPDLCIVPASGKVFVPEGEVYDWIYGEDCVASMCTVLREQVFIDYDGRQGVAVVTGVDSTYEGESPLSGNITDGTYRFHKGSVPMALVGRGLASRMGISPHFVTPLDLYFPNRTANISIANPAASIESVRVFPSGIFSVNSDIDDNHLFVPIDQMRELLCYEDEVSAVEIRLVDGTSVSDARRIRNEISSRLEGSNLEVRDRFHQNESLYKMMRYEKLAIFLILIFVIIIIAFNIFGSLSMLIIEKRGDAETLRCLGADDALVRRIFVLEGWMISLLGLAVGLVVGIAFSLLQQHFGIIKMPGNYVVSAYPVALSWWDVLWTVIGVSLIGYIIALLPVSRLKH